MSFITYTPVQPKNAVSASKQRIVRMVETQRDPMSPPRFPINKKIPRGPPSPPAAVLHSPPRKLNAKEQQMFHVPPCISKWKNPKGYTIPLDKRCAGDANSLQQTQINEKFNQLAEALYVAERKARESVSFRAQMERKMAHMEREKNEAQLHKAAQQMREAAAGRVGTSDTRRGTVDQEEISREEFRRERQRERQRERNLKQSGAGKRGHRERDISEQIALGMANPRANQGPESQFDQRLFNTSQGMDSGFAGGVDDLYNVYTEPWRGEKANAQHIYRPSRNSLEQEESLEAITKSRKFVADKEFSGVDHSRAREAGPVAFEKEEDIFGLTKFFEAAKMGEKRSGATTSGHSESKRTRKD